MGHMVKSAFRLARNVAFDLRYGAFLGGVIPTRYGEDGAANVANTDYGVLPRLFADLIREDDVLVDVGCGKGRVLNWWLNHYPRNRIIGVELDPQVGANTARRLRRWPQVSIRIGSVVDAFPDEGTLFYLFNPFSLPVMEKFVTRFMDSPGRGSGRRIIYYNCVHRGPFLKYPELSIQHSRTTEGRFHPAITITERYIVEPSQ